MASNTLSAKTLAEQEAGRNAIIRTAEEHAVAVRVSTLAQKYKHLWLYTRYYIQGTDRGKWEVYVGVMRRATSSRLPEYLKNIPEDQVLFSETVQIDAFPSNELLAYLALFED